MKRSIPVLFLVLLFAAGCGYRIHGDGERPYYGVNRIHVPAINNATTYTNLTYDLTNEIISRLSISQGVKVTGRETADAVLDVSIVSMEIRAAARERDYEASASRRVVLTVEAVLKRTDTGEVLWQGGRIQSRRTYQVTEDQSFVEANLARSLKEMARELADKIQRSMIEDF